MSFGLQVFGNDGAYLVSEANPGLHYVGDATHQGSNLWRVTGHAGRRVLPFFIATARAGVDRVWESSPGVWDIQFRGATPSRVLCFSTLPNVASNGSWGMRVTDGSGNVCFDSTLKPINVRQIIDYVQSGSMSGLTAEALASGITTPAVYIGTSGSTRGKVWGQIADFEYISVSGGYASSTQVLMGDITVWSQSIPHAPEENPPVPDVYEDAFPPTSVLVIDASHY